MKVVKLTRNNRSTEWRQQFAEALIALRPDINPDAADEIADAQYLVAAALEPRAAATHLASGTSHVQVQAMQRGTQPQPPARESLG